MEKDGNKKNDRKVRVIPIVLFVAVVTGISGFMIYWDGFRVTSERLVKSAMEQLQAGDYDGAAEKLEQAIAREEELQENGEENVTAEGVPYVTEAYRGLGMVCFEQENYEQARTCLQQAVDLGAEPTPALYNMIGISAMHLGDYDSALSAFAAGVALPAEGSYQDEDGETQSVDYSGVIQEMRFNRIVCFEKKLDWSSAKAEIESYTADYPEDADAQKEAEFLSTR